MPNFYKQGAPVPTNAEHVLEINTTQTGVDHIANDVTEAQVVVNGVQVQLPPNPQPGQQHIISCKSAVACTVAATGGHAITVTAIIASTFRIYRFLSFTGSVTGEWISQALS